ncbi:hypothetical protein [Flavobacterium sp. CF136]|uniref:hypothetical protein n=1 Tax=Flavobacterium sp. (strain CF136) TaxID=1144313 RepID=UPI0002716310|nr:hypothetical protein [Flavobacterium sp. CF136]EJL64160.1 hypothetical protein PMI10_02033 [Flavobacterium sp. CF136]
MKYFTLHKKILDTTDYIPNVAGDKLPIDKRKSLGVIAKELTDVNGEFDYLRCYGFGDEDNPDDFRVWESQRFDIYRFTMTDVNRLFVSEKCMSILSKYRYPESEFKFYPAKLLFQGQKYNYFIFQQHDDISNMDQANTEYVIYDPITNNVVENYDGELPTQGNYDLIFSQLESKNLKMKFSRLVLNNSFNIFSLRWFFWGAFIIIDENVKEDLERNEVTGVDFEEIDFEIQFKNVQ